MMLLDVRLTLDRRRIHYEVIYQHESIRSKNNNSPINVAINDLVEIKSVSYPALDENILFIRGTDRSRDSDRGSYGYADEELAKKCYYSFIDLINKVNGISNKRKTHLPSWL